MEYLVNVAVHGVAGLSFGDKSQSLPNPYVRVCVFGEVRETRVVTGKATCSLGHFFSVSRRQKPEEFAAEDVQVTVLHSGSLGLSRVMGQVTFSLRRVRAQPLHLVETGWFPVALPEQPGQVRGFVQLTVGAYGPGDKVPRAAGASGIESADGEGSSVRSRAVQLPSASGAVKSLYQLTVRVHNAEGLRKVAGAFSEGCHPFVRVEFNGTSQQTQVQSGATAPVWNAAVKVPFMMPCWDDSVNVRLFSQGGATSRDTLLGEICLEVGKLDSQFRPTWYNFYYAPEEGGFFKGSVEADSSLFGGRLLASANVDRVEVVELTIGSCPVVRPPAATKHVFWADFYEICFECAQKPDDVYASVCMEPFLRGCSPKVPERRGSAFLWSEDDGRVEPELLVLPEVAMCSDVIVSVHARFSGWVLSQSFARYMYLRIPAKEAMHWDAKPRWYEMHHASAVEGYKTAGFVLMSLNLGPQGSAPKRPRREKIKVESYRFRARVYQAANLPVKDEEGSSDPFAVVFFGSAALQTEVVGCSLNPSWYQVLEAQVEVPANPALRPNILVLVVDQDEDGSQPLAMMRYPTREAGALPVTWPGPPRWFPLEPMPGPGSLPTQGKLLASFELEPYDARKAPPPQIYPPTVDCRVEFFAIGVRLRATAQSLPKPRLEVAWGRKEESRVEPKRAKYTEQGRGGDGQYNMLERLSLSCKLAKDPLYQDWLEVRLLVDAENDDHSFRSVAFASVQLAQYLPWIDQERRRKVGDDFKVRRLSELKDMAVSRAARQEQGQQVKSEEPERAATNLWKRCKDAVKEQEQLQVGWDVDSIEASNARCLGAMEFTNVTQEDEEQCAATLQRCLKRYGEGVEWSEALQDFCKNFEWPQHGGTGDDLDRHPDLDGALELGEGLPYAQAELLSGTEWGEPEVIGVLKFCCRVVDKEKHKRGGSTVEEEERAWDARLRKIEDGFRQAQDLVIRTYVLSADGLTPCSGSSDCSTYVWSRATASEDDQAHSFRDNLTVRHHTLQPQFNKCHAFTQCRLPENAMLEISVVELIPGMFGGTAAQKVIGSTIIDIEDRWFHHRYHSMVEEDIVPIEARELRCADSCFSRGHLRLWIDVMLPAQSQARRLASLPSTEPLPFQLRIVIWKVTGIEMPEGEVADLYVSGRHELDDGKDLREETDTHYGADDGIGTFNWRLLFDLKVPCRDPRVLLRVWNKRWLQHEPLAEVTLDLSRDFQRARKENTSIELPRGSVRMTHPSYPGEVCGLLELEGLLLPEDEASMRPAGTGRDEPNEDPFLDGEDAHLKAHRDYFGNLEIVQNLQVVGRGLLLGFKLMTVLYIVGGVLGGGTFVAMAVVTFTK